MILSERSTEQGLLVTVCDRDALGETYESDGVSIEVTEEFYGGDAADPDDVEAALDRASIANLVGQEAVTLAIEAGHVDEANVLEVGSTLHAQFLRL